MGRWAVGLVVLAGVAFACGEAGTIIAEDGGASDGGEGHDVVFVPQVDGDGGDATMEEDGTGPSDAGVEGEAGAVLPRLGEPTFSPASGMTILQSSTITIAPPAAFPAGGAIFYTLDGAPPTHQSLAYVGPVQIAVTSDGGCGPSSATVEATASAPGFNDSFVAIATYQVLLPQSGLIPVVVFNPASETNNNDFPLSLTGAPGTIVCYTLDGSSPSCSPANVCAGSSLTYSGPIPISGAITEPADGVVTVSALDCLTPSTPPACSSIAGPASQQNYQLIAADPTMTNPAPGTVASGVTPTLSTATVTSNEPVSIHMTTDGTKPTCTGGATVPGSSTVGPFTTTTTVNAIACKTGYLPSNAVTFVYTIP
jgi:hypothetical protein